MFLYDKVEKVITVLSYFPCRRIALRDNWSSRWLFVVILLCCIYHSLKCCKCVQEFCGIFGKDKDFSTVYCQSENCKCLCLVTHLLQFRKYILNIFRQFKHVWFRYLRIVFGLQFLICWSLFIMTKVLLLTACRRYFREIK